MNITKWLATAVVSIGLAACGGGGGSPGAQGGSAAPLPPPVPTIGIGLFNAAGAAISTIAATENNFAAAKVVDGVGNPVAGRIVTFSVANASLVTLFPPNGTALTDSKGVASVLITPAAGTSGGATTIEANSFVGATAVTAKIDFGISPARAIPQPVVQLSVFDPQNRPVSTVGAAAGHYALARVLAGSGAPVSNRLVKFTVGNASLIKMDPPDGSAITDSAGNARVGLTVPSGSVGGATSLVVEANAGEATVATGRVDFAVLAFPVVQVPQTSLLLSLRNGAGAVVSTINNADGNFLLARLADSTGSPIVNRLVTISTVRSGVVFFPADGTGLTNSNGEVRISVSTLPNQAAGAGTIAGTALVGTVPVTAQLDVALAASQAVSSPRLDLAVYDDTGRSVSNIRVGQGNYVEARLINGAGRPVVGRRVAFIVAGGEAIASLTPADGSALTDVNGVARVLLNPVSAASAGARSVLASASVENVNLNVGIDFAVVATGSGSVSAPTVAVQVVDRNGVPTNGVSLGAGNIVRASFVDSNSRPLSGRRVSFSLSGNDATLASFSPASGSALTDANGIASIQISPLSLNSAGAITVVATAGLDGLVYSGQKDVSVSATSISISNITLGSSNLLSGANTSVSVLALLADGVTGAAGVNILFSASCGQIQNIVITNGTGAANATYSGVLPDGSLCSGPVTINATSPGTVGRNAGLTIAAPRANAITFIDPSIKQIFVKSSGAREQTIVQFKVLAGNVPMPNEPVLFSLGINPTGSSVGLAGSAADIVVTTDAAGVATVPVFSGAIPGPLEVRASLQANTSVFTISRDLTVASGPPSQRFFSMSIGINNMEGHQLEGGPNRVTVRVADRQGNPVPDGTVINFSAEGGQVGRSCVTELVLPAGATGATLPNGGVATCSVGFVSQFPRPDNRRVSVMAYAEGVKDYVDLNGNNQYDPGVDSLIDMGDAYRDDNESQSFNFGEFVIPKLGTLPCPILPTPVPFAFAPTPSRQDTCTGQTVQQATVRDQRIVVFASSNAYVESTAGGFGVIVGSVNTAPTNASGATEAAQVQNLLPMPAGTLVTAVSLVDGCTITVGGSPIPNIVAQGLATDIRTRHSLTFKTCPSGSGFNLIVTAPSGVGTSTFFSVP